MLYYKQLRARKQFPGALGSQGPETGCCLTLVISGSQTDLWLLLSAKEASDYCCQPNRPLIIAGSQRGLWLSLAAKQASQAFSIAGSQSRLWLSLAAKQVPGYCWHPNRPLVIDGSQTGLWVLLAGLWLLLAAKHASGYC